MQSTVVVIFLVSLGISTAVPVLSSTQVIQGPSTKTTIIGPGNTGVIHASAPGGTIIREEAPGYVASTGTHGVVASYGIPIAQHGLAVAPIGYGLGHGAVLSHSRVLH